MSQLAPIALFVYNRPDHLERSIKSLLENELADQSILHVFCDGFKNEKDKEGVLRVQSLADQIKGFRKVIVHKNVQNRGLATSVISGVNTVLDSYESVIVLEDDLLYHSQFLEFMNWGLNRFANDDTIASISGYRFPIKPTEGLPEIYKLPRPCSWGWGTWRKDWKSVDWSISDYDKFLNDKEGKINFNIGGNDLTPMLIKQMQGKIDSWAIRWAYHHYKNQKMSVFPNTTFVQNIGLDGSGTHNSITTSKLAEDRLDIKKFESISVSLDDRALRGLQRYFGLSIVRKVINKLTL